MTKRWNWTMSASETRTALFGSTYARQPGKCDHLPEVVDHQTLTYRCGCGMVVMSKEAMVDAESPSQFLSYLRSLIVQAHEKEGWKWCDGCCSFQPKSHEHPKPKPVNEELVTQLMEQVLAGKLTKPRAAAVCRMIPSEFQAVYDQIQSNRIDAWNGSTKKHKKTQAQPTPKVEALEDEPVVARGFRLIDLDD